MEVFSEEALEEINKTVYDKFVHEHVTLYFVEHPEKYKQCRVRMPEKMRRPDLRFVIDEDDDYKFISRIYKELYSKNPFFGALEAIDLINAKPELAEINRTVRQKTARE